MQERLELCQQDLRIAQMTAQNNAKLITDAARDGKFSETLVKQLLRQGEDRKATVEDTKLLDVKVKEVKSSLSK